MSGEIVLRAAEVKDAAQVARLAGELGYPVATQTMAQRLEALLAHPSHHIAVAEQGTALLGWIAVERRHTLEAGERIEIVGLVVGTAARRTGVGKLLVADAEWWAREQGVASMFVRSSIARDGSHPFYEGLGYTRKKTQHVYVKPLSVTA